MKVKVVNGLVNILGAVKFLTAKDASVRDTLLYDYKALRKVARRAEESREDVVAKFNADYAGKDPNGEEHRKGLDVLNKAVGDIMNEDVDISLKAVEIGDFTAISGADSLNLEQFAFLIEWGVLKDE